jgi:hypothetical protein
MGMHEFKIFLRQLLLFSKKPGKRAKIQATVVFGLTNRIPHRTVFLINLYQQHLHHWYFQSYEGLLRSNPARQSRKKLLAWSSGRSLWSLSFQRNSSRGSEITRNVLSMI